MLTKKKQNPLVIIGLIIVIVIAIGFIIKTAMPKRYRPPDVNWTCEACGYQFVASSTPSSAKCPKCGKIETVRSTYYKCRKCDHVFEAYRMKMPQLPATPSDIEDMPHDEMMEGLIKRPGGEWVEEMSEEGMKILEEISCPKCGNKDRDSLKYYPPATR